MGELGREESNVNMKFVILTGIMVMVAITGCHTLKKVYVDGWYTVSSRDHIVSEPFITVRDFAELRLDSAPDPNGRMIYGIIGHVREDKVQLWADVTEKSVGKTIAFVFEGQIITQPMVNARIESGSFSIFLPPKSPGDIKQIFRKLSEEIEKNKQDTTSVDWKGFHHLFDAWVQNYRTNSLTQLSSNTSDASKLEQYPQLLQMDKKIIPGIIVRLSDRNLFFALTLYDALQDVDSLKSFDYGKGEQFRAQETVRKYLEAMLQRKKRIFHSDSEKIQEMENLAIKYGWEIGTLLGRRERDSLFINMDYEITAEFLKNFGR